MVRANDPSLQSWVNIPNGSDFPIQNLPLGVASIKEGDPVVVTRIGDFVADLNVLNREGLLGVDFLTEAFETEHLNLLLSMGKDMLRNLRDRLSKLFDKRHKTLQDNDGLIKRSMFHIDDVRMLLPIKVQNYTDFYSSKEHATNVGSMFRDPANALLPNWKHIPIGYHGRASSIVVSGTPIRRPKGQIKLPNQETPAFEPTRQLDFELEMAFITCKSNPLGEPIPIDEAEDYIWGMVIFNDWSARDIQSWEYVPLGPFLGKSFASSISPWVVALDALKPFRLQGPEQEPKPLPYLQFDGEHNYDISLEVLLGCNTFEPVSIAHSNHKYLYWNMLQQLTHHASNGCNIQVGDMYASGTISGPIKDSFGSMLELTWRGTDPLNMPDGTQRKFIENGDTVVMRAFAENQDLRIGFGEVVGTIVA